MAVPEGLVAQMNHSTIVEIQAATYGLRGIRGHR
jgi:hypothetical protein